jgi:hypothetical protein
MPVFRRLLMSPRLVTSASCKGHIEPETSGRDREAYECHEDKAPPRRPAIDAVVGSLAGIREPTPAPGCLQAQSVPHRPLEAGAGREAFLERRNSKAEADHGLLDPGNGRGWPNPPGFATKPFRLRYAL